MTHGEWKLFILVPGGTLGKTTRERWSKDETEVVVHLSRMKQRRWREGHKMDKQDEEK